MFILLLFSFFAGIVTVLSPCILPVLPILLSAGGSKNFRPLGIVVGVIFSFTFFTLSLAYIVHRTGLSSNYIIYLALAFIFFFGLVMIIPSWSNKFAEFSAGIASTGYKIQKGSAFFGKGFWSGFTLGIALGLIWTPCAGPIFATITALIATSELNSIIVLITFLYSVGAALPMLLIIYGGNRLFSFLSKIGYRAETIRKLFGLSMIFTAIAIAFHYDVKFQEIAIQYFPLINIEENPLVIQELDKIKATSSANKNFVLSKQKTIQSNVLPKLAPAPELIGITDWVNSKPLSIEDLRGKVVLIDFWTYSCINCIRTFPFLRSWYDKYHDLGLIIIGVHTPEFEFEKNLTNVQDATKRFGIEYPVALDNDYKTWQNYNNRYWPAHYLIDQNGIVRDFHFGEGAYVETENSIRTLLGLPFLQEKESSTSHRKLTPETYLGFEKATSYIPDNFIIPYKEFDYDYNQTLKIDQVGLRGPWLISEEKITSLSDQSFLDLNFVAGRVYLVMEAPESAKVLVYLNNRALDDKYFTSDMDKQSEIIVKDPRKYDVLNLRDDYGRYKLTLKVPKGVSLYAFTFGDTE